MNQGTPEKRYQWYLSLLGFALLAGTLAAAYFTLTTVVIDLLFGQGQETLSQLFSDTNLSFETLLIFAAPTAFGAALSWWLLVVLPKRSNALMGGLAGLLTVVIAPLGVAVALAIGYIVQPSGVFVSYGSPALEALGLVFLIGLIWIVGLLYLLFSPVGWGVWMVAIGAGALYGALIGWLIPTAKSPQLMYPIYPMYPAYPMYPPYPLYPVYPPYPMYSAPPMAPTQPTEPTEPTEPTPPDETSPAQ